MTVAPDRFGGWVDRFAARHGTPTIVLESEQLLLSAPDGAAARCRLPIGAGTLAGVDPEGAVAVFTEQALNDRRVGLLLVRLGGYAVGVAEGDRLVASKVGSRLVQGRSAAGGWSQQRFARRREAQGRLASAAAADTAARILLPELGRLEAVVLGGSRPALRSVLADRRLEPLALLVVDPLLEVPDPRQRVLEQAVVQLRAVRIRLGEADGRTRPMPGIVAEPGQPGVK